MRFKTAALQLQAHDLRPQMSHYIPEEAKLRGGYTRAFFVLEEHCRKALVGLPTSSNALTTDEAMLSTIFP